MLLAFTITFGVIPGAGWWYIVPRSDGLHPTSDEYIGQGKTSTANDRIEKRLWRLRRLLRGATALGSSIQNMFILIKVIRFAQHILATACYNRTCVTLLPARISLQTQGIPVTIIAGNQASVPEPAPRFQRSFGSNHLCPPKMNVYGQRSSKGCPQDVQNTNFTPTHHHMSTSAHRVFQQFIGAPCPTVCGSRSSAVSVAIRFGTFQCQRRQQLGP